MRRGITFFAIIVCMLQAITTKSQTKIVKNTCSEENSYSWEKGEKSIFYIKGGEEIGRIKAEIPKGIKYSYSISNCGDGTYCVNYRFTARRDNKNAKIKLDFVIPKKATWWMIPSVSYNGNEWGRGKEPKTAKFNEDWWTFSYRRTPIPGAIYSENNEFAVATWSDVPKNEGQSFSCSIMTESDKTTHRIIWPEEEMPVCYSSRDTYTEGWQKKSDLKKGETIKITMYVNVTHVMENHLAIQSFITSAWNEANHDNVKIMDRDTVWNRGIDYFKKSLWAEDSVYTGFSIGLIRKGDGWKQRSGGKYESGWCGQNISIAISMLEDYLKNGDSESLNKGIRTLDCWAKYCPMENGLFHVHFDDILKPMPDRIIDACNLGTTALNYFEAYDIAKKCGYCRPEYLDIAYKACDFVIEDQQLNGCFARGWHLDGSAYVREGTIGCFMVPAIIEAWNRSKNEKYLESAVKAYDYYISQLHNDGFTTAGALDTWCIDKESAISLLRSSLRLYRISLEKRYLYDAVQISSYLSTWMWHYKGIYPEDDSFTKYGWNTFGATSVSVQHNHLDPYAGYWIPEWFELSELTGDSQWREKAIAIWNNVCQLISDGNLEVNGAIRPRGAQNEAYFESAWGFDGATYGAKNSDGNSRRINDWLVAWPGAFRLETLRHCPEL